MVDGRERERTKKEEKQAPCPRESISTSGRVPGARKREVRWAPNGGLLSKIPSKFPPPEALVPRRLDLKLQEV